jgi:hypothetical protein
MTVESVAKRVETVFAEVFGQRLPFSPELTRAEHMEFLVALEMEFGIRFDGADAVDMQSIATVIERVAQRTA